MICELLTMIVIGIDSAGWPFLDDMMQRDLIPNIEQLVESGARADLPCHDAGGAPCFCPVVWGTYMTGRPLSEHGMTGFDTPSLVPTLLDIVPGENVGVGWHNVGPFDDALIELISTLLFDTTKLGVSTSTHAAEWAEAFPEADPLRPLWAPIAEDRAIEEVLQWLGPQGTRLVMANFRALDRVSHLQWGWVQPENLIDELAEVPREYVRDGPQHIWDSSPLGTAAGRSNPVREIMEIDASIGRVLEANAFDYVMLISDHAMTFTGKPYFPGHHHVDVNPEAHTGIFAISGPGIEAQDLGVISALDVAPTILELLAEPVPPEFEGQALEVGACEEQP